MLEHTGETEDAAEPKKVRRKESKKSDVEMPAAGAEPAPPPGSPMRGQRRGARSFFAELREELQAATAGPAGTCAAACRSRERVEVVEFHSRKRRGDPQPRPAQDTKVRAGQVPGRGEATGAVVSGMSLWTVLGSSGAPSGSRMC